MCFDSQKTEGLEEKTKRLPCGHLLLGHCSNFTAAHSTGSDHCQQEGEKEQEGEKVSRREKVKRKGVSEEKRCQVPFLENGQLEN